MTQAALATFNNKVLTQDVAELWFHHGDQEYRYPNGSVIAVAGLDDAEKVKSSDYDMVYVQEATELVEDDWSMLIRGLRNGVMPYQQIMADCNPGPPDHWLKQRCDSGACLLIESRHEDNPSLWNEALGTWTIEGTAYIAGLDSLRGYLYKRLRLGLWVAAEGMFFTEWNPSQHVVDSFDPPPDVDGAAGRVPTDGFAVPWGHYWLGALTRSRGSDVYRELFTRTALHARGAG
jgi:phage terminase large subunit